jgi:hypothetical protein
MMEDISDEFISYSRKDSAVVEKIFATINWRNIKDHPIDTTSVEDVYKLLGKGYTPQSYVDVQLGDKYFSEMTYNQAVYAIAQLKIGECYHNDMK